jgi:WD40 repeat protein
MKKINFNPVKDFFKNVLPFSTLTTINSTLLFIIHELFAGKENSISWQEKLFMVLFVPFIGNSINNNIMFKKKEFFKKVITSYLIFLPSFAMMFGGNFQNYNHINDIRFSPDKNYLAVVAGKKLIVYDIANGNAFSDEIIHMEFKHSNNINSISFSNDSKRLAVAIGEKIIVYNISKNNENENENIHLEFNHLNNVKFISFSNDSKRLLSTSDSQEIIVHDIEEKKEIFKLTNNYIIDSISFLYNNNYLAFAGENYFNVFELDSGKIIDETDMSREAGLSQRGYNNRITISNDNTILAYAYDNSAGTVELRRFSLMFFKISENGGKIKISEVYWDFTIDIDDDDGKVNFIKFSPESENLIIVGTDENKIVEFKIDSQDGEGEKISEFKYSSDFNTILFSPDNSYLVMSNVEKTIKIYKKNGNGGLEAYQEFQTLKNENLYENIESITFSPDSKYLVYGGRDEKVIIYDIEQNKVTYTYQYKEPFFKKYKWNNILKYITFSGIIGTIVGVIVEIVRRKKNIQPSTLTPMEANLLEFFPWL